MNDRKPPIEISVIRTKEPEPAIVAPVAAATLNGCTFRWHGEAYDGPLKEWLVEGMLPKVGKALISGQWGTYKTFAAMDLAGAVMTKTTFAGKSVNRQGGVLFIAVEGQDEVLVRLEALAREKIAALEGERDGVVRIDPEHLPFVWIEDCPRLTADDAAAELNKIIEAVQREMQTRFKLPLALIIIDTLMPAAGFKDADDAAEAQRVMTVLGDAAKFAQALVVAVDHFGKDASTGTRNSSAKEDNADAVLALLGERSLAGIVSDPRMALRKVRSGRAGEEIHFETHTVVIEGRSGSVATSLVIDWIESESTKPKMKRTWPKSLTVFKAALDFTLADTGERVRPFFDGPEVHAAKRDWVRVEFMKAYPADNADARGEAFRRAEKLASAQGLIAARIIGETMYFWTIG